jgi:hypothetical protein
MYNIKSAPPDFLLIIEQGIVLLLPPKHRVKRKVKLSLGLINKALCHYDVWRSGGITPLFLTVPLDGCEW